MRNAVCVIASVVCLSACNKGPTVELHNATTQQVAEAVILDADEKKANKG